MTVRSESRRPFARGSGGARKPKSGQEQPPRPLLRDTIFALSSAPGRAGIAVFRVSGPRADQALQLLSQKELPTERHAEKRTLFNKSNYSLIDDVLVLRFVAPRSYTGENIVEFHTH